MKTAYLGLPYSDPDSYIRYKRFIAANKAAAHLFSIGFNVFSPISHSHGINLNVGPGFWTTVDSYWQKHCEFLIILRLTGWTKSVGLEHEYELAELIGQKVLFMNPNTYQITA